MQYTAAYTYIYIQQILLNIKIIVVIITIINYKTKLTPIVCNYYGPDIMQIQIQIWNIHNLRIYVCSYSYLCMLNRNYKLENSYSIIHNYICI